jgi:hypothetical protein
MNTQKPDSVDFYEADQDPSDGVIGGSPDDQGGTLHANATVVAHPDTGEMISAAEVGVNAGEGYTAAYLGPRDARALAHWLIQYADWRDAQGTR